MPLYQPKTLPKEGKKIGKQSGFTLIELLVVISIVGILGTIVFSSLSGAKEKARFTRTKAELHSIDTALEMYISDNSGNYPPDADRGLPPGLEKYLGTGNWPNAPWPGSTFDWDNWSSTDLSFAPFTPVRQISVRFCPVGQPTQCQFPNEPWAANFDYYSSVYYCVSGPCRAHSSQLITHPAYCLNC